ncbi:molybdopterin biosynthesis protein MoeB [Brevundimonas sp. AAP58]|uniref:HesA/MoeB/ThiF family protein n=1 Tax=Brevundimonas sp. AAP58 TaxID=1523422 RepID=UPI0006B930B2|nr:HesA/MoeB/ThiF family protein [Brevundimonas sp. AAP58]KPF77834.1 molybdopterin biosynthesis protein MoeB [Brevundimonas sp. AAP58]
MGFSPQDVERYARHLVLSEIGGPGQQKLAASTVAVIGAGGVGSPAALYLAAAGVGTLRIIDPDTVSLSNLQRQVLFDTVDTGRLKVEVAERRLAALNPGVRLHAVPEALTAETAARLITGADVVLDGTDDFDVRHAVNAACVAAGIPLVSGALGRWSGQVGVFTGRPCYRCLVPDLPPDAETCARVGVVGALAGVIGSMAALEVIKLVTGAGEPLTGRLLLYDGLSATSRTVEVTADPGCPVCSTSALIQSPARGVPEG